MGSGKWVRSIKDKSILTKEILEYCSSLEELKITEEKYIKENIDDKLCMNFNLSSCGFSSGHLNHNYSKENRKRNSERIKGEKNPMYGKKHSPETLEKLRKASTGRKLSKESCDKLSKSVSNGRKGIKYSITGRQKLSESRKKQYKEGKRGIPTFEGKSHSQETKNKMSEARKRYWSERKNHKPIHI